MTLADLAEHEPEWVAPLAVDFRGVRIHELPPNGQGLAALIALGILDRCDLDGLDADGAELGPSVRLLRTPGHTAEDISTVASAPDGVYVCTHAWWSAGGPEEDPLGADQIALVASRKLLLEFADVIIPGHGAPFRPGTPA